MLRSKFSVLQKSAKVFTKQFFRQASIKPYTSSYPPKPLIVTVTGSSSNAGRIASLILKQCPLIDELRLFDFKNHARRIVEDLNIIDTAANVKAFIGLNSLKTAIEGAHVVLSFAPEKQRTLRSEKQLFYTNADDARTIALHTSEFNPKAILCLASPPVNSLVPMVSEEYKKSKSYDFRRIIGLSAIDVMRANSIVAKYLNLDPRDVFCPVIGGSSVGTIVAVLSHIKQFATMREFNKEKFLELQKKIAKAESDLLYAKTNDNVKSTHASRGYAGAKFVMNLCRALKGDNRYLECAFIKQTGHIGNFLPYMSSIVRLGQNGIERSYMPHLNSWEGERLSFVSSKILKQIQRGEAYVTGKVPKHKVKKRRCRYTFAIVETLPGGDLSNMDVDFSMREPELSGSPPKNPGYLYRC